MGETQEQRAHKLLISRLRGMGLEVEPLPGGRCARFELPLRPVPFPGLDGPLEIGSAVLATVGSGHAKCLAPLPLFMLPMVPIAQCASAAQIEDAVRAAWARHGRGLREAQQKLGDLGCETRSESGGAGLAVPLGLDDTEALGRMIDARRLALPARGLLAGLPLARPEEREFTLSGGFDSAIDLELAVTSRLEALARKAGRVADARRRAAAVASPAPPPAPALERPLRLRSRRRILLVGALLGRDKALQRALQQLGFRTRLEYSASDALAAFAEQSFDVVLTDTRLGRSEGLELIPEIGALPGIAKLPIVLVDEHARPARRQAAREIGASGYLVHPIDPARITAGLERMATGARGRRFERVEHRLAVAWRDEPGGFTQSIGRGGLFLRTGADLARPMPGVCEIVLPGLGERLRVGSRPVYTRDEATGAPGMGLRFEDFPDRNEALWIDYLSALVAGRDEER